MKKFLLVLTTQLFTLSFLIAQDIQNNPASNHGNKFEQLGNILPTGNEYRTASGAPGPKYWQQRCDYDIKCELDEKNLKLSGSETITYYNNSPDILPYLWLQLDENQHSSKNNAGYPNGSTMSQSISSANAEAMIDRTNPNDFGVNIIKLTDAAGNRIKYLVNKTMMRVDLPTPLKPGQKMVLKVDWNYRIPDRFKQGGRGGYEFFPDDGNYIFTMAQWYPRLCVYSDFQGWQNHQFTGTGEFALTFGNFKVQMTVPADHVVGSTGECQNYAQVLSPTQLSRWQKAQTGKDITEIVTLDEAKAAEARHASQIASATPRNKTYIFKADNVRDFAWGSSPKFVWDAMPVTIEGKKVMCMSFYGKEAYPIYRRYSTKAVAHAIKTYSEFSVPYPYPVAQSVEAANGMEYPMICFNPGRAEKDGTYTEGSKNACITVVIHEVGHNFFPMIINSDERQWTWLDEGLNTFVQTIAEELWDNKYPSWAKAYTTAEYMKLPKDQLEPIMTNSENINDFFTNQYVKVATGLHVLRETIMGRELFDFAFKEYARRWAFKHPTPADFFRSMEDASGEDLDWFWRGWFYSTDATDISIDSVKYFKPEFVMGGNEKDTVIYRKLEQPRVPRFDDISKVRNREDKNIIFETDADTTLRDFYWRYARGLEKYDSASYGIQTKTGNPLMDEETKAKIANKHFYEMKFTNKGGLIMPIILEWTYKDGTKEYEKIPAQVWRKNEKGVTKVFIKDKEVASVKLDPMRETADIDENNNSWPKEIVQTKFQVFKSTQQGGRNQPQINNPMQKAEEKKKAFAPVP
jgi:hypothetical protein